MSKIAIYREKVQDILAGMTPRDRLLTLGLVITFGLTIIIASVVMMSKSIAELKSNLSQKEIDLNSIQVMKAERADILARSSVIEKNLEQFASTDLSAFLEQSARKVKIQDKLNFVRETASNNDGILAEKRFSVSLSNLNQEEIARFLFGVETSGYPLKIRSCNIKTRKKKGEITLEMTLDIASYKLVTEEEG
ncbi:MAG: hypothetical protein VXZ96_09815 [Myxococcota bacterium]|nr:hypothetical protein [Myxococcota bacterium]